MSDALPPATVGEALRAATAALAVEWGRIDAELLMAHALGVSRSAMLLHHMRDSAPAAFASLLARRLAHEPVAYILGEQEFYGRPFAVTPDVLIPRGDSEAVVAAALAALPAPVEGRAPRVLDLGTGSGALLLTVLAERGDTRGVGLDRSHAALAIFARNLATLGLEARGRGRAGNWHAPGWTAGLGAFDLILANPPYVESDADLDPCVRDHEPAGALFAGPEGLDDYRALIPQLPPLLAPGGVAVLEIGARQRAAVAALAAATGARTTCRPDLAGRDRALILRWGLGKEGQRRYLPVKPASPGVGVIGSDR